MEITKLIVKRLEGALSESEEEMLNKWLKSSSENRHIFERIMEIKKSGKDISVLKNLDTEGAWGNVLKKYSNKEKRQRKGLYFRAIKYAAIFIGLFGVTSIFFLFTDSPDIVSKHSTLNKDAITLQLENGEVKVLSSDGNQQFENINGQIYVVQRGTTLAYDEKAEIDKLAYNILKTPYGKRFDIQLSDGTSVYLNAGSTLKYPIKFITGEKRQVFLTGEAYFDVSEDKEHPFVVSSEGMNVEVLGTRFNVSAYPEDNNITTVLVEGSVQLAKTISNTGDFTMQLEPGHLAHWNKATTHVVKEVVDTRIYTGWIDGRLVFKKTPFSAMIPKLERYFNLNIQNEYADLENQIFTAIYDIETIEEVLMSLKEDTPFDYEMKDGTIIIRQPIPKNYRQ